MDKISLLEEELSLVKAHLLLECSPSDALLRSKGSESVSSLTACPNCKNPQSRLIECNRAVSIVRQNNAFTSKVSKLDLIYKEGVSPVRIIDLSVEE